MPLHSGTGCEKYATVGDMARAISKSRAVRNFSLLDQASKKPLTDPGRSINWLLIARYTDSKNGRRSKYIQFSGYNNVDYTCQ